MAKAQSSTEARRLLDAVSDRVAGLHAKAAEIIGEYQETRLQLTTATATELDALSRRSAELERAHADVSIALQGAQREQAAAAEAFAVSRLPELVEERDEAHAELLAMLAGAVAKARPIARRVAEAQGQIAALALPQSVSRPTMPQLGTEESALLSGWGQSVIGGDGATVEVRFVKDAHYTSPPAGLPGKRFTRGTVVRVPVGAALQLERDGDAERVEAA